MDLKNCPECGKVFVYNNVNLCPACRKQDEAEFIKVKEYLQKNPKIGIFDLAEATEVDEEKIVRWVREGRIEGKNYSGISVSCDRCGKLIQSGRYCTQCSSELAKGFYIFTQKDEDSIDKNKVKFHIKE
ncbi:MAG: MerR family transcriptional regulator [Bacillota bacterium]